MIPLDDAHCHYQAPELAPFWPEIFPTLPGIPLGRAVVNGTAPQDWSAVEHWCQRLPQHVIPSFGLHPWYINKQPSDWLAQLKALLEKYPTAGVGEFGLDQWVAGHDLQAQLPIFRQHWHLAQEMDRVASIHCVQAWGPFMQEMRNFWRLRPNSRGFLIHAYGGPAEMVSEFVKLGAYFSFSPYFLNKRKIKQSEVFSRIPLHRLLIETDAPALFPPAEANRFPLTEATSQETLNHPANLEVALAGLAALRKLDLQTLASHLKLNFNQLWRLE